VAPIRDPKADVVKSGAFRLTWVSGAIGGIGALIIAFNKGFTEIFGDEAGAGIKASVLIAIIAAWAVIAVADLLARAITTSARLRSAPAAGTPAPDGMQVTLTDGVDSPGWLVAAVRGTDGAADGDLELLVVKAGEKPRWVGQDGVLVEAPKASGTTTANGGPQSTPAKTG
jgi:hypothetical protein